MTDLSDAPTAPRADRRDNKNIAAAPNFDLLAGVSLRVSVEVGSTSMTLAELLATKDVVLADGATGTNPEQLFAVGYSACFLGALKFVAGKQKVALPPSTTVTGKVGIGPIPTGFGIQAELTIAAPGVAREQLQALVDAAHIVCPYSNATRGNIDVTLVIAD